MFKGKCTLKSQEWMYFVWYKSGLYQMQIRNKGRKKHNGNCPIFKLPLFWESGWGESFKPCVSTYRAQVCKGMDHNQRLSQRSYKARGRGGEALCKLSQQLIIAPRISAGEKHGPASF